MALELTKILTVFLILFFGVGVVSGQTPTVSSFAFSDQESTGNSVVVDSVTLSAGGFVVIHNADGDILGVSRYVDPGEDASNLAIALDPPLSNNAELTAMAHKDVDNNERFNANTDTPYMADGAPVTTTAQISVGAPTPEPTHEPTPEPTPKPTPEPSTSTSTDTTTPSSIQEGDSINRGFFTNDPDSGMGFLDNALNITTLGLALSIIGILMELRRGG